MWLSFAEVPAWYLSAVMPLYDWVTFSEWCVYYSSLPAWAAPGIWSWRQRGGKGQGQGTGGQWKSACGACGPNVDQVGIGGRGVGGLNPPTPVHVYTYAHFCAKIGFKFWSMGKISNISTSECAGSFHNYHICKLLSSHFDKCIVTLGHFSTTNISTGGN